MTLYDRIDETLERYATDNAINNISELDGFFHALACSPDLIPPSVWMNAIWGSEDDAPEWPDMKSAQDFFKDLMQHYNTVMQTLNRHDSAPLFLNADTDTGNELIADDWCIGFQRGIGLIENSEDKLAENMDFFAPILLFSSSELESRRKTLSDQEIQSHIEMIPACVLAIHHGMRASTAASVHPANHHVESFVRDQPRIGRNDPCPCGSGRKYKKCCGAN